MALSSEDGEYGYDHAHAQTQGSSSPTVDLPFDASLEILSRCSLQTIAKFRTLSHRFNSLTYQSYFNQLLHRQTPTLFGFFLRGLSSRRSHSVFATTTSTNNNITLDFLPAPARIMASTPQGFMTCITDNAPLRFQRYYVVKPATKQWVALPNPKTKYFTRYPVGMIVLRSNPLRVKIVRLSDDINNNNNMINELRCEVFDSGTWSWKQLDHNVELRDDDEKEYLEREPSVSARGSLHWLTSHNRVMAFHGDTNRWDFFPLPRECWKKDRYDGAAQLVEYEGKLGVIVTAGGWDDVSSCVMQLWVVERYRGEKLWVLRLDLDLKERFGGGRGGVVQVLGFCDAETVVLERSDGVVVVYEFRVGRVRLMEGLRLPSCLNGFFVVRSDLESSDLGRPEENRASNCTRRRRRRQAKEKGGVRV